MLRTLPPILSLTSKIYILLPVTRSHSRHKPSGSMNGSVEIPALPDAASFFLQIDYSLDIEKDTRSEKQRQSFLLQLVSR